MTPDILDWLNRVVKPLTVDAKLVYEVGSLNVNGSARDVLQRPDMTWLGMDFQRGMGVDIVVDNDFTFGDWWYTQYKHDLDSSPDLIVSCEALEHDPDPYGTLQAMRGMAKMDSLMVITTPGQSFPYHAYPYDYFRVGIDWIRGVAFKDWRIIALEQISQEPYTTLVGVAQKI